MNIKNKLLLISLALIFGFLGRVYAEIIQSDSIHSIEDLIKKYNFKPKDTIVVFDIDNTILIYDLIYPRAIPVEDNVSKLIHSLQMRSFQVIALTARTPSIARFTQQQLTSLGIDLTKNNPRNDAITLSIENTAYINGILFCGILNEKSCKGLILNDFLRSVKNKQTTIISIDDKTINLEAEEDVVKREGIEFKGIYYNCFERLAASYADWVMRLFQPKTQTGSLIRSSCKNGYFRNEIVTFLKNRALRHIKDKHFTNMLQMIASRENCFCNSAIDGLNTHCVFYSSVPPFIAYFQDILAVFYEVFKNKKSYDSIPLRVAYNDFQKIRNAKELCEYNLIKDKQEIEAKTCKGSWDQRPLMRRTTLCANAALFETIDQCSYSESAIDYFIYPRMDGGSIQLCEDELSLKSLLHDVFSFFGIDKYFEPFGMRLIYMVHPAAMPNPINSYIDLNNSSRLLQIFVPREYVDQCVYFCIGGGNAYQTDKKASTTCELLKSGAPVELSYTPIPGFVPGAPARQARILLHPSFFGNPTKGFKVFTYNKHVRDAVWKPGYFEELRSIATEIKQYKDGMEFKHSVKSESNLDSLIENFKMYKTRNIGFHSGDLYEHSIWVGNAIKMWAEEKDIVWCEGLDARDIECAYLAALLHDVGKAGDFVFHYFNKPTHPQDGFLYLTGKKKYWLDLDTKFDFNSMFKQLGIDDITQKIVTILVGIHGDFGNKLMRKGATTENLAWYISRLSGFCANVGYNGGRADEKLLKLAILVSAADIKGAQPVMDNGTVFWGLQNCSCMPSHHSGASQFDLLEVNTTGVQIRQKLVEFFNHQNIVLQADLVLTVT